jgi:hypothetical protein
VSQTLFLPHISLYVSNHFFAPSPLQVPWSTAWSSYLSLICYHQCWMPPAEPQHDLAQLGSKKVSRVCPIPHFFAELLPVHFSYNKSPCKFPTIYLLQVLSKSPGQLPDWNLSLASIPLIVSQFLLTCRLLPSLRQSFSLLGQGFPSTALLASVPVFVLTPSFPVSLTLCSSVFSKFMLNCQTRTCAWPS